MKNKKDYGSAWTPLLLIILLVTVAYIITPSLDGMNAMFEAFMTDLEHDNPTAMAIFFLIALVLGGGLAIIADIAHKK